MAKVTEKQLKELATGYNMGILKDTACGLRIVREKDGYSLVLAYREGGKTAAISAGMSASETGECMSGFVKGIEIGQQSKHVYCPKCNARATLVPEDEFTKEHIFCPTCGARSRRQQNGG